MGFWDFFSGGGGSTSNDTSNDSSKDDSPGFFDDGGALESFFDGVGLDVDGDAADGVSGGVANLGDTNGDGRGEFAFTDNASDEDRNNVTSGNVGTAGTITNVQDNIVTGVTVNTSGDNAGTITSDSSGADVTNVVNSGTLVDLSDSGLTYQEILETLGLSGIDVGVPGIDTSYVVQPDDTLSEIAEDLDTSVGELMDANPDITNPNEIVAGDTINIGGVQTGVDTYEGMDQQFFDDDTDTGGLSGDYYDKLVEAGESDTSTLDEIAASDTTGIDVYEPTGETVEAVEDYYTTGAGSDGYTSDVDYSVTGSGEDYTSAAESDTYDVSGGTQPVGTSETLTAVEQILVDTYGYIDNGDGTLTSPQGYYYDADTGGYQTSDTGGFATTTDVLGTTPVDVNTYSDSELVVPEGMGVGDIVGFEDTVLDPGEGGLGGDDDLLTVGTPMTEQLATELGITYFEGDRLTSADLEDLRDKGFVVDEDAIVGSLQGQLGEDAITFVGQEPISTGAAGEPTISASRLSDLESYIKVLQEQQRFYTVDDLDAAGFTADEIAAYDKLVTQGGLTEQDIMALQEQYGSMTLPQIDAMIETFGPELGTLLQGSGAFFVESIGNLMTALGDTDAMLLEAIGAENVLNALTTEEGEYFLSQAGEGVRVTGAELQEQFLVNLQNRSPDLYEDFMSPIVDPATGDFNMEALKAKAIYSSIPTLIGLSGIPFGAVPAVVTGGLMTAAEIGTEARNETFRDAKKQGFDDDEAEAMARSANLLGAALGMPVGAASNLLLGTVLKPGAGLQQIANMTSAILQASIDEGYIEQNTIQTAVNAQFEGAQGVLGTDIAVTEFSPDEFILGGLTGGVISVGAYAKAKARGMTDQEISQQIQNTPNGETVTLKDSTGAIIEQGAIPVSDVIFSGNPVEMRTDADGNTSIVDTVTGESATMPSGTVLTSGGITGGETTVQELTASEILQSDNISIGQDANGNLTLTDNDTGLTTNIEGDLYYDAFGNMYESAEEAQAADALFGLTGTETTVADLQATEDSTIGGMGTDVTVKTAGENIELTNEETGLKVSIPLTSDVNIVDIVSSVQDNNISGVADSGGTVVSIGTGTTTITSEEVQDIVDGALAGLSDTATSEDVSTAINEALAGLTDLNADDVKEVIDTALGDLDMLGSEDVETVITDALADLENISADDVESIVSDALSGLQDVSITDIETAISDALAELPETASPDDVTTAINDALAEMENLSSEDVETVVSEALGELENLSSDDVTTIVSDALAELENVSAEDIETIVSDALAELPEYATPDDVSTAINDAIGGLENISSEDVETIVGDALSEMENLSTEDVQSIVDSATESIEAGVTEDIGALETALTEKIDALEEAGVDRAEAVDTALTELSDEIGTTKDSLLETIGTTETNLVTQLETVESNITEGLTELSESIDTSNLTLSEMLAIMEEEKRKEEEYLASLEGEPELDRDPTYDPVIADPTIVAEPVPEGEVREGIAAAGIRPTVAPYYQPMQTGEYSFYRPEPGVSQATPAPVFQDPIRYLAPTSDPLYGYGYVAPNMDIARLTRLAAMQDTGAEQLASEDLINE